jgi:hypothetical protein
MLPMQNLHRQRKRGFLVLFRKVMPEETKVVFDFVSIRSSVTPLQAPRRRTQQCCRISQGTTPSCLHLIFITDRECTEASSQIGLMKRL